MGDGSRDVDKKIGLIAGQGSFPLHFAQAARRRGETVVAVALKEEADPSIERHVDAIVWLSLGQLGKTIDYLKAQGVTRAVMAGRVKHARLFHGIVPDWRAAKLLTRLANNKAASLLSAVADEFKKDGIEFLPSTTYLDDWLCPAGILTRRPLTADEKTDIAFGWPLARRLAGEDIGQTVVVKDKTVVAVEAMEGTDDCIRRAGRVAGEGCVVVKAARPRQDLRFDMPVVGAGTLASMREAGARVLALETGKTLLLEKEKLLETADAFQLTLTGLHA